MVYFALTCLAGALTIFASCILPVVPFVFARVDQPFAKSCLPLLAGMAISFAGVASLGSRAVDADTRGRRGAIVVLALMGAPVLATALAARLTQVQALSRPRLSLPSEGTKPPCVSRPI